MSELSRQLASLEAWLGQTEARADTAEHYAERRLEGLGDRLDSAIARLQRDMEYRIETLERRTEGRR